MQIRSLTKLRRAVLQRGISTASSVHTFKGVVFGLWNIVAAPQWTKHEQWELENKIPAGTLKRLAAKQEGAMRGMLVGLIGTAEGFDCLCCLRSLLLPVFCTCRCSPLLA